MTTLFRLAHRADAPRSLVEAVQSTADQYGMTPKDGGEPCSCATCKAEHLDVDRHVGAVEGIVWARLDGEAMAWVLSLVYPTSNPARVTDPIVEAARQFGAAWDRVRMDVLRFRPENRVIETDEWVNDLANEALSCLFQWSEVRDLLRKMED